MIDHIIGQMMEIDWKAYVLTLFGFLGGAVSNTLGEHYGIITGLIIFLLSWWLVLAGILLAARKATIPIGRLAQ